MNLDDLELSVRTIHILEKCGVETTERLENLHLWKAMAQGAGHLVAREIRLAQLSLFGATADTLLVSVESVSASSSFAVDEATVARAAALLEGAGWKAEPEQRRWRQLLDPHAVNRVSLYPGVNTIQLSMSQFSDAHDGDIGGTWLLVPREVVPFVKALIAIGSDLQWARFAPAVVDALLPHVARSYVRTRLDPENPAGGQAALPLEPPTAPA